jgi:DNA-nicking Smr family endonuclease
MKRRSLNTDDQELWNQVAKTAKPLHGPSKKRALPSQLKPKKSSTPRVADPAPIMPFNIGERAGSAAETHDLKPSIASALSRNPVQMDAKAYGKMRRGKLGPEATIDLHGMTLQQAHPALVGFVLNGHSRGLRLLLVITGKGKKSRDDGPIPRQMGVLRHQVPQWLRMAPLAPLVLQVTEAHIKHGGGGAYYVYLRRRK